MVILGVIIGIAFIFFAVVAIASRPSWVIYALAFVVSVVGINVHVGITFYLSRIVLIIFFISLIFRIFNPSIKLIWLQIPILSLFVQFISIIISTRIGEGMRQLLIYGSLFVIFLIIIVLGTKTEVVVKAIKVYLFMGIIQGLYGIYQIIGGVRHWPTYQTLMVGIPMANDRTVDGYFYTGAYSSFRAIGFFSSDVSHFAGYMAGVLIIALSLIAYNKRSIFPYAVLLIGGAGLLFSLSRSGILAFVLFGLPTLFFLLRRFNLIPTFKTGHALKLGGIALLIITLLVCTPILQDATNPLTILSSRFENILNPRSSSTESMSDHLLTRKLALSAFQSSPVIGVGLGVNAAPWYSNDLGRFWAGSHSYHLDILGQTGLLGAILEWLLMLLIVRYMWSGLKVPTLNGEAKTILAGLLSAYITIILGNFLYYYYLNDFVWFIMGTGVALSRCLKAESRKELDQLR